MTFNRKLEALRFEVNYQEECFTGYKFKVPDPYFDGLFSLYNIPFPSSMKSAAEKRKREFLAGRICARAALGGAFKNFNIGIGKSREPIWPKGVKGSISHTNEHAVAVCTTLRACLGVGLDIERVVDAALCSELMSQILSETEQLILPTNDISLWFTTVFSAKESFFKSAYCLVGKYFDFDALQLLKIGPKSLSFQLNLDLAEQLKKGKYIEVVYEKFDYDTVFTFCVLFDE